MKSETLKLKNVTVGTNLDGNHGLCVRGRTKTIVFRNFSRLILINCICENNCTFRHLKYAKLSNVTGGSINFIGSSELVLNISESSSEM
jgi:hypothetical protein